MEKTIRCAVNEHKSWKNSLFKFLLNFRSTPNSTTKKSPSEVVLGYQPRLQVPGIRTFNNKQNARTTKELLQTDRLSKAKIKEYADKTNHARLSTVKVGDTVLLRRKQKNKLQSPFDPEPFTITRKAGSKVVLSRGIQELHRNVSNVKLIKTPNPLNPNETKTTTMTPQPGVTHTRKDNRNTYFSIPLTPCLPEVINQGVGDSGMDTILSSNVIHHTTIHTPHHFITVDTDSTATTEPDPVNIPLPVSDDETSSDSETDSDAATGITADTDYHDTELISDQPIVKLTDTNVEQRFPLNFWENYYNSYVVPCITNSRSCKVKPHGFYKE